MALYPLMPDKMTVNRDENKEIYYLYQADVGQVRLPKADVLHIPGLGFDGLVGYSPIAMSKNAIGLAIATEEYGSKFFANGANPGGVLEHPGTLKDPAKLRESWNAMFGGSSNAAKVAVLEEGMKYTPISMSPEQAQFLETRKFQLEEIARIFRVPLHMVGDLDHATFSNVDHLSLDFVKFSLSPWLNRWEKALNKALLSRDEKQKYFIKFNVDELLRGDYATRQQGYATGIQNGFLSPDDVREIEDLNPIPGGAGAKYYFNGNMLPIEQAGAAYGANKEEITKMRKFWKWVNQTPKNLTTPETTKETKTNQQSNRTLYLNGQIAEVSWFDDDITPKLFKDELMSENGNIIVWINSPGGDWEERKLHDLLNKNSEKNKDLLILNVESVSNKTGFTKQTEQFENYSVASSNLSNYYVIREKQFAYNPSRINVGSIAYKAMGNDTSVVSPLYVSFSTKNTLNDGFLWNWFKTTLFDSQRQRLSEGGVRDTLSFNQLSNMVISFPEHKEQEKIGLFFKQLDDTIALHQRKLDLLKKQKKGFLQKMFVS